MAPLSKQRVNVTPSRTWLHKAPADCGRTKSQGTTPPHAVRPAPRLPTVDKPYPCLHENGVGRALAARPTWLPAQLNLRATCARVPLGW
eukprot:scaffold990_cov393-Prasinococcus_capsulatus_cf.AAC.10